MSKARDTVETLRTVLVDGDVTNANFTGADLDIAKGGTGASTAGAARTALGLAIGSDVQAFDSAIMVDGDIGTTVQAHDADTAKLDANANFTGTLQRGGTDVLVTGDVTNANFTGADLEIAKGGTGASSAGAARTALGLAIGSDVQAYDATIVVDGDIGTTVQGYDANTAKLDEAANFTGTLQNGGSNVIVDSDIGTTVLAPNGSGANLTDLPAGGNVADFVATGTLPNGKPVVLKSDGTVEVVHIDVLAQSVPLGSEAQYESGNTTGHIVKFDPNTPNRFIVYYTDASNSYYPTLVVGTVSGSSLSFSSPVVVASFNGTRMLSVDYNPNVANRFVVTYQNGYHMRSKVCTSTASNVYFGTEITIAAYAINEDSALVSFDPNTANSLCFVYAHASASSGGRARAATISGTTLTLGTEIYWATGYGLFHLSGGFSPLQAGRFVYAFRSQQYSYMANVRSIHISGLTCTHKNQYQLGGYPATWIELSFDPHNAGQFIVVRNNGAGGGVARHGTYDGTQSISYGSEFTYNSTAGTYNSVAYDLHTPNRFVITYQNPNNSNYGTAIHGTVSGTSLSATNTYVYNSGTTQFTHIAFDPHTAGKFITVFTDASDSNKGKAILGQLGSSAINLTSTNYLGLSKDAYTNGQTASISLAGGISTNQSSLTAGSTYYVQTNGTLSTSAGTPSVEAGKAVSATTLLLKGI